MDINNILLNINQTIKQQKIEIIKYEKTITSDNIILGKYKYYDNSKISNIIKYLNEKGYNKIEYKLQQYKDKQIYKQIITNENNNIIEYKIDTIHNFVNENNFLITNYSTNNVIMTKFPNIIKYSEINNYEVIEYNKSHITVQLFINKKQKIFIKILINIDLKRNNVELILFELKTNNINNLFNLL